MKTLTSRFAVKNRRDGVMRSALMRRVAWAIYRVQDIVQALFPLAVFALALFIALALVSLERAAQ